MDPLTLATALRRGWVLLGLVVGLLGGVTFVVVLVRVLRPRAIRREGSRSRRSRAPESRDAWSEAARRLDPPDDGRDRR